MSHWVDITQEDAEREYGHDKRGRIAIPAEAIRVVEEHLRFYVDRPGTDWSVEATAILEAAAPRIVTGLEGRLAEIIVLLDPFERAASDEAKRHCAYEAVLRLRAILDAK